MITTENHEALQILPPLYRLSAIVAQEKMRIWQRLEATVNLAETLRLSYSSTRTSFWSAGF